MSWDVSKKEFSSVISLPGDKRYSYFIKKVSDWEEVWSLHNAVGWVLMSDDKGAEIVPIWPHKAFAQACISNEWKDCGSTLISLDSWIEKWIPGIIKDGRRVAVFPTPRDRGLEEVALLP